MQIGPGGLICFECGSRKFLREIHFRGDGSYQHAGGHMLVLCGSCCAGLEKILKVERERPHMKEVRKQG